MPSENASKSRPGKILVGTASWSDPGFVAHWYPKKMPAHERLAWYARQFEMVEVNSAFYSVPDVRTVERWVAITPDHFVFDVKLHQLFSFHSTPAKLLPPALQRMARTDENGKVQISDDLRDALLKFFLNSIWRLQDAEKLGVLLLQLSPAFSPRKHALSELDPLLLALEDYAVAVELRNRQWAMGDQLQMTREYLTKHHASFVNVDAPADEHFTIMPSSLNEITNRDVAYLRLHGRDAKAYTTGKTVAERFKYDYDDSEIEEIAQRSRKLAEKARDVHVVFNNNALDYAPRAAARLRKALGQIIDLPPRTAELF